jgi:hypothetical protein
MIVFALLIRLAGLSQREAAMALNLSPSSMDKMVRGVRRVPPGVMSDLRGLIERQEIAADEFLRQYEETVLPQGESPEEIQIGFPVDDHEAQSLGWPCIGAWSGMAARIAAAVETPVKFVPRGSTPATAAAIDAYEIRNKGRE